MSRFFRSPNSSGSESSSDDEDDTEEISAVRLSQSVPSSEVSTSSPEPIVFGRESTLSSGLAHSGREWLLHSLLEERCLIKVREERSARGMQASAAVDEQAVQREARRRYQILCSHLAPLSLVSSGLDDERFITTRQSVRDQLDSVDLSLSGTLQRPQAQYGVPAPLRRLLNGSSFRPGHVNGQHGVAVVPGTPFSFLDGADRMAPARYWSDFEEIGFLGKGGYGEVFHVKHRLDGRAYAVKKVPIRPHMVSRIGTEGEPAVEEILREVRSLSKLSHPNVVRYFSSWIEWSTKTNLPNGSWELTTHSELSDAVLGAEDPSSRRSLRRVRTESETVEEAVGITFESRSHNSESLAMQTNSKTESSPNDQALMLPGLHLALHMQMDMYPMTLADFISPKPAKPGILHVAHCFHLETSLRLLLVILEGVEYLHTQSVVHRDLKPANIFLKPEDDTRAERSCVDLSSCNTCKAQDRAHPVRLGVCIGDFGLVTNIAQTEQEPFHSVAGTEIYQPASRNWSTSPRLDIFALGIIAYELLHKFDTQMERRQTLQNLKLGHFPKTFATCAGQYSAQVREIITTMLSDEEASIPTLKRRLSAVITAANVVTGTSELVPRRQSA